MKKTKLQEILKNLNSLERSIPIGETQSYLDQMISGEFEDFKKSVQKNPTITFLNDLNTKLEKFKRDFNLKPVLETIQDIQNDIELTKSEISSSFEVTRQENEAKLNELSSLIRTVRSEFSSMTRQNLTDVLNKIAKIEDDLSFSSSESDRRGKSLSQILDGYESVLTDLIARFDKSNEEQGTLRTVLDAGFIERDQRIQEAVSSIEKLRTDLLSRISSHGGQANRQIKINSSIMSTKYTDINLKGSITKVDNNVTKEVDITFSGGGSGPILEVNGTPNVDQTLLNLVQGSNMTITDNGDGSVTFASSGGGGGMSRSINTVSVNTTGGTTASTDYVYFANGITFTLPTAVGNTNLYTIKNIGGSSVLVATTGGQTIDGSANAPIYLDNQALDFISDNTNWRIV